MSAASRLQSQRNWGGATRLAMKLPTTKLIGICVYRTVQLEPHYFVRRYAEFAASVLSLHKAEDETVGREGSADEMLLMNLYVPQSSSVSITSIFLFRASLRKNVVDLVSRLSGRV